LAFAVTEILPREGEVVGWKKCRTDNHETVLVKVRVPADAKRSNATARKCRAERVEVLSVEAPDGTPQPFGISLHDSNVRYVVGETVKAHEWGADRFVECAGGIHFFLTREEAAAY
jgi:hypothetical protein